MSTIGSGSGGGADYWVGQGPELEKGGSAGEVDADKVGTAASTHAKGTGAKGRKELFSKTFTFLGKPFSVLAAKANKFLLKLDKAQLQELMDKGALPESFLKNAGSARHAKGIIQRALHEQVRGLDNTQREGVVKEVGDKLAESGVSRKLEILGELEELISHTSTNTKEIEAKLKELEEAIGDEGSMGGARAVPIYIRAALDKLDDSGKLSTTGKKEALKQIQKLVMNELVTAKSLVGALGSSPDCALSKEMSAKLQEDIVNGIREVKESQDLDSLASGGIASLEKDLELSCTAEEFRAIATLAGVDQKVVDDLTDQAASADKSSFRAVAARVGRAVAKPFRRLANVGNFAWGGASSTRKRDVSDEMTIGKATIYRKGDHYEAKMSGKQLKHMLKAGGVHDVSNKGMLARAIGLVGKYHAKVYTRAIEDGMVTPLAAKQRVLTDLLQQQLEAKEELEGLFNNKDASPQEIRDACSRYEKKLEELEKKARFLQGEDIEGVSVDDIVSEEWGDEMKAGVESLRAEAKNPTNENSKYTRAALQHLGKTVAHERGKFKEVMAQFEGYKGDEKLKEWITFGSSYEGKEFVTLHDFLKEMVLNNLFSFQDIGMKLREEGDLRLHGGFNSAIGSAIPEIQHYDPDPVNSVSAAHQGNFAADKSFMTHAGVGDLPVMMRVIGAARLHHSTREDGTASAVFVEGRGKGEEPFTARLETKTSAKFHATRETKRKRMEGSHLFAWQEKDLWVKKFSVGRLVRDGVKALGHSISHRMGKRRDLVAQREAQYRSYAEQFVKNQMTYVGKRNDPSIPAQVENLVREMMLSELPPEAWKAEFERLDAHQAAVASGELKESPPPWAKPEFTLQTRSQRGKDAVAKVLRAQEWFFGLFSKRMGYKEPVADVAFFAAYATGIGSALHATGVLGNGLVHTLNSIGGVLGSHAHMMGLPAEQMVVQGFGLGKLSMVTCGLVDGNESLLADGLRGLAEDPAKWTVGMGAVIAGVHYLGHALEHLPLLDHAGAMLVESEGAVHGHQIPGLADLLALKYVAAIKGLGIAEGDSELAKIFNLDKSVIASMDPAAKKALIKEKMTRDLVWAQIAGKDASVQELQVKIEKLREKEGAISAAEKKELASLEEEKKSKVDAFMDSDAFREHKAAIEKAVDGFYSSIEQGVSTSERVDSTRDVEALVQKQVQEYRRGLEDSGVKGAELESRVDAFKQHFLHMFTLGAGADVASASVEAAAKLSPEDREELAAMKEKMEFVSFVKRHGRNLRILPKKEREKIFDQALDLFSDDPQFLINVKEHLFSRGNPVVRTLRNVASGLGDVGLFGGRHASHAAGVLKHRLRRRLSKSSSKQHPLRARVRGSKAKGTAWKRTKGSLSLQTGALSRKAAAMPDKAKRSAWRRKAAFYELDAKQASAEGSNTVSILQHNVYKMLTFIGGLGTTLVTRQTRRVFTPLSVGHGTTIRSGLDLSALEAIRGRRGSLKYHRELLVRGGRKSEHQKSIELERQMQARVAAMMSRGAEGAAAA